VAEVVVSRQMFQQILSLIAQLRALLSHAGMSERWGQMRQATTAKVASVYGTQPGLLPRNGQILGLLPDGFLPG
jgi:hypothetical protein